MTFEEILPGLKAKKKICTHWLGRAENYVQLLTLSSKTGLHLK